MAALLHDLLQDVLDAYDAVLDQLAEVAVSQEAATYGSGAAARPALLPAGAHPARPVRPAPGRHRPAQRPDPARPRPGPAPAAGAPSLRSPRRARQPRARSAERRDEQLSFADVLDHAVRLEQAVATQHDLLVGARTAYHTWVATGVAQATRTLLVAICLVSLPTLVFAVYGMNFGPSPSYTGPWPTCGPSSWPWRSTAPCGSRSGARAGSSAPRVAPTRRSTAPPIPPGSPARRSAARARLAPSAKCSSRPWPIRSQ